MKSTYTRLSSSGVPCDVRHVSPRKIECTSRAPGEGARLTAPQAGKAVMGLFTGLWLHSKPEGLGSRNASVCLLSQLLTG